MKVLERNKGALTLNGVAVAELYGDNRVRCLFPAKQAWGRVSGDAEAETFVLSQLAWFTRAIGVAGPVLGEGEPVIVCTVHSKEWAVQTGTYRAHDGSVEVQTGAVCEMSQRLVLRSPVDWSGIDERLFWDA